MRTVKVSDEVLQNLKSVQGYLQMSNPRRKWSLNDVIDVLIHAFVTFEAQRGNIILINRERDKENGVR